MRRSARRVLRHLDRDRPEPVADDVREPAASSRYDRLTEGQVLARLGDLSPSELAQLGVHERAHQNRVTVLAHIDARLGHEPWPGYDALDVDGVRFGLDGAERDRFVLVLAYERAHKNRAGVVLAAQQLPRGR